MKKLVRNEHRLFFRGDTIIRRKMKIYRYFFLTLPIVALTFLAGCSALTSQMNRAAETVKATPTPIALPTQLSVQTRVESQTCKVAELIAIQTDEPQGDLMAWSPTGHELAFVQPVNQYSGFYIGDLTVYDASNNETIFTSDDKAVFGDLIWSPDGSALAYVALDQTTGVYTVKTVTLADGVEVDIFGDEAATDDFASQKGILSWTTAPELIVTSVCGSDCVRVYQYNLVSQTLIPLQEIRYNENTSLALGNDLSSPDGTWTVSIDNNENTWLISNKNNQISLLLALTELMEEKFSKDSQYLAVRTAEQVIIYQLGCKTE
jgi:WD40 repeat protein